VVRTRFFVSIAAVAIALMFFDPSLQAQDSPAGSQAKPPDTSASAATDLEKAVQNPVA
jgi:hypothetical protein